MQALKTTRFEVFQTSLWPFFFNYGFTYIGLRYEPVLLKLEIEQMR